LERKKLELLHGRDRYSINSKMGLNYFSSPPKPTAMIWIFLSRAAKGE
jgi:hypothetical protein